MTTVGYVRVSKSEQNPQLQIDALKAAGCTEFFIDKASGANIDRPELTHCMARLMPGDVLMIWKLDRLGRSMIHLCEIVQKLVEDGIGFKVLTQPIDTTTSGGRMVFHIFASIAEFERELIRERTVAGLAAARAQGRKGGRKPKIDDIMEAKIERLVLTGFPLVAAFRHFGIKENTGYLHFKKKYPGGSYSEIMRKRRVMYGLESP